MTNHSALLARLESAEPYSDELRNAVLIAAGWVKLPSGNWISPEGRHWNGYIPETMPNPVRSIDDSNELPGANIVCVAIHLPQTIDAHWVATQGSARWDFRGQSPLPGPEGEARARTAAS